MGKETGLVLFCDNVKHDGCGNVVDVGCVFIMIAKDFNIVVNYVPVEGGFDTGLGCW